MNQVILSIDKLVAKTDITLIGDKIPIDLDLSCGEILAILDGRWASQLLKLIIGNGKHISGDIYINDCKINKDFYKHIGIAYRDKGLLSNLSIRDNIELPSKYHGTHDSKTSNEVFKEIELNNDDLDKRPHLVSWSTRKKALIARSVILAPQIILMDDPTNLFPESELPLLYKWIKLQKQKGRSLILGTDNITFAVATADKFFDPKENQTILNQPDKITKYISPNWIAQSQILKKHMEISQ